MFSFSVRFRWTLIYPTDPRGQNSQSVLSDLQSADRVICLSPDYGPGLYFKMINFITSLVLEQR